MDVQSHSGWTLGKRQIGYRIQAGRYLRSDSCLKPGIVQLETDNRWGWCNLFDNQILQLNEYTWRRDLRSFRNQHCSSEADWWSCKTVFEGLTLAKRVLWLKVNAKREGSEPTCTYDTNVGGSGSGLSEELFGKESRCLIAVLGKLDYTGDSKLSATYPELACVPIFWKHVHVKLGLWALSLNIVFQVLKALFFGEAFRIELLQCRESIAVKLPKWSCDQYESNIVRYISLAMKGGRLVLLTSVVNSEGNLTNARHRLLQCRSW